ncbi:hypothetical protein DL96DRAFT_1437170, partial [Flagelloscypha sp. PMI_526]
NAWVEFPRRFQNASDGKYSQHQDKQCDGNIFGAAPVRRRMPNHTIIDIGIPVVQGLR